MTDSERDVGRSIRQLMRRSLRVGLGTIERGSGEPYVSLAMVALDHDATPLLYLSDLADHTANLKADPRVSLALGQCLATIAYAQLIAENARRLVVAAEMISTIFHLLVSDLSASALALASLPRVDAVSRILIRRLVAVPRTRTEDWDFVSARLDDK